jgi:hypothetical protein
MRGGAAPCFAFAMTGVILCPPRAEQIVGRKRRERVSQLDSFGDA